MKDLDVEDVRALDGVLDLVLSSHGCAPGCGCEHDFFDQSLDNVHRWTKRVGRTKAEATKAELKSLLERERLPVKIFADACSLGFGHQRLRIWLAEWKRLVDEALVR